MNLTRIIDIKERIAISEAFKPDEREFMLECINEAIERRRQPSRMSRDQALALAFRLAEHPGVFPSDVINVIEGLYERGLAIVTNKLADGPQQQRGRGQ